MSLPTARLACAFLCATLACNGGDPNGADPTDVADQALGRVHRPPVEAHWVAPAGGSTGELSDLFLHTTAMYTATVIETPDDAGVCPSPNCTYDEAGRYVVIGNIKTNQLTLYPGASASRRYQLLAGTSASSTAFVRIDLAGGSTSELVRAP